MKKLMCVILTGLLFSVSVVIAKEAEKQTEQTMLIVQNFVPDSPAEKSGILVKDIFLKYDGKPVNTLTELNEMKAELKSESVEITVLREGKELMIKLPKGQMGVYLKELLPDVKYKADAVVIEGIPKLSWGTGKINSFLACVELAANYLGIKKDYVEINGVSGAAFRLHFCKDWCPSSPDPTCGYNNGEDALKALGLEYKSYSLSSDGKNKPEIKKAIMQSIDKKMPVIAIDLIDALEWGLIAGYQNNGEEFLCRTYFDKRNSYEIAQKFPWALYVITGKKDIAKDAEVYRQSFKTILANLTTENYGQYYSGINAFDKWIEHLEKSDFAKMDSQKFNNAVLANGWIFDRLIADRNIAGEYLVRVSEKIPELSSQIKELINIQQEEMKIFKETKIIIPNSNYMGSTDDWTAEMRQEEIALLQKAKAKEEVALKIWQEIVKTEGENK
jgi:hypothetical protein